VIASEVAQKARVEATEASALSLKITLTFGVRYEKFFESGF
jgi:hypothetical protein